VNVAVPFSTFRLQGVSVSQLERFGAFLVVQRYNNSPFLERSMTLCDIFKTRKAQKQSRKFDGLKRLQDHVPVHALKTQKFTV